jgi:hypothetical protein
MTPESLPGVMRIGCAADSHEHTYLNFAEGRRDANTLWTESAHRRVRRVKAAYDPENVIRSNHPLD